MTSEDLGGQNDDVASFEEALQADANRDRDGVSSLRDTEAEEGDEEGLEDTFDRDEAEERELGAGLDAHDEPEPRLD